MSAAQSSPTPEPNDSTAEYSYRTESSDGEELQRALMEEEDVEEEDKEEEQQQQQGIVEEGASGSQGEAEHADPEAEASPSQADLSASLTASLTLCRSSTTTATARAPSPAPSTRSSPVPSSSSPAMRASSSRSAEPFGDDWSTASGSMSETLSTTDGEDEDEDEEEGRSSDASTRSSSPSGSASGSQTSSAPSSSARSRSSTTAKKAQRKSSAAAAASSRRSKPPPVYFGTPSKEEHQRRERYEARVRERRILRRDSLELARRRTLTIEDVEMLKREREELVQELERKGSRGEEVGGQEISRDRQAEEESHQAPFVSSVEADEASVSAPRAEKADQAEDEGEEDAEDDDVPEGADAVDHVEDATVKVASVDVGPGGAEQERLMTADESVEQPSEEPGSEVEEQQDSQASSEIEPPSSPTPANGPVLALQPPSSEADASLPRTPLQQDAKALAPSPQPSPKPGTPLVKLGPSTAIPMTPGAAPPSASAPSAVDVSASFDYETSPGVGLGLAHAEAKALHRCDVLDSIIAARSPWVAGPGASIGSASRPQTMSEARNVDPFGSPIGFPSPTRTRRRSARLSGKLLAGEGMGDENRDLGSTTTAVKSSSRSASPSKDKALASSFQVSAPSVASALNAWAGAKLVTPCSPEKRVLGISQLANSNDVVGASPSRGATTVLPLGSCWVPSPTAGRIDALSSSPGKRSQSPTKAILGASSSSPSKRSPFKVKVLPLGGDHSQTPRSARKGGVPTEVREEPSSPSLARSAATAHEKEVPTVEAAPQRPPSSLEDGSSSPSRPSSKLPSSSAAPTSAPTSSSSNVAGSTTAPRSVKAPVKRSALLSAPSSSSTSTAAPSSSIRQRGVAAGSAVPAGSSKVPRPGMASSGGSGVASGPGASVRGAVARSTSATTATSSAPSMPRKAATGAATTTSRLPKPTGAAAPPSARLAGSTRTAGVSKPATGAAKAAAAPAPPAPTVRSVRQPTAAGVTTSKKPLASASTVSGHAAAAAPTIRRAETASTSAVKPASVVRPGSAASNASASTSTTTKAGTARAKAVSAKPGSTTTTTAGAARTTSALPSRAKTGSIAAPASRLATARSGTTRSEKERKAMSSSSGAAVEGEEASANSRPPSAMSARSDKAEVSPLAPPFPVGKGAKTEERSQQARDAKAVEEMPETREESPNSSTEEGKALAKSEEQRGLGEGREMVGKREDEAPSLSPAVAVSAPPAPRPAVTTRVIPVNTSAASRVWDSPKKPSPSSASDLNGAPAASPVKGSSLASSSTSSASTQARGAPLPFSSGVGRARRVLAGSSEASFDAVPASAAPASRVQSGAPSTATTTTTTTTTMEGPLTTRGEREATFARAPGSTLTSAPVLGVGSASPQKRSILGSSVDSSSNAAHVEREQRPAVLRGADNAEDVLRHGNRALPTRSIVNLDPSVSPMKAARRILQQSGSGNALRGQEERDEAHLTASSFVAQPKALRTRMPSRIAEGHAASSSSSGSLSSSAPPSDGLEPTTSSSTLGMGLPMSRGLLSKVQVAPVSVAPPVVPSTVGLAGSATSIRPRPLRAAALGASLPLNGPASSSTGPPSTAPLTAPSSTLRLSSSELNRLTTRNTRRNEVYLVRLDVQTVRVDGSRPPSPTSKIRKSFGGAEAAGAVPLGREEAVKAREMRARRRSDEPAEEDDDEEEDEEHGDAGDGVGVSLHALGAGEEERYSTPPRLSRCGIVLQAPSRRLRWDKALVTEPRTFGDEAEAEARRKGNLKSCLSSSKRPALDKHGNVTEETPLSPRLRKMKVVVKRVVYEGEN